MQELCFLCMTSRLNVLYKCMKFCWNTSAGYKVIERTRNSIANDQKEMNPKISKAELWFLCMTHCLIVLKKCMKFQPNSFNSVQLTKRTKIAFSFVTSRIIWKINARDMVLVHNTSSECGLQMYEVSLKYLYRYQVIERTRNSVANDQREITPKLSKAELWFLCMTRRLDVLYKCM